MNKSLIYLIKYFVLILLFFLIGCSGFFGIIKERPPQPHKVDGGILFQLDWPSASSVVIAGSFNDWASNENGRINDLSKVEKYQLKLDTETGLWKRIIDIPPGRYIYKFVINQGETWIADPNNRNKQDDNSLIIVSE